MNGTHLRPFAEGVSSAAFSPDSRTVATGEADGAVVLREAESGKELHRFVGHTANVASVAFSPDGQTAVSGSYDKTIRLWRMPKPGSAAPELDPWTKSVQALPPEKQVEAVAAKLKELNPGFDGKLSHRIEGNAVTRISLLTDHVRDVAPLRAVSGLSNIEFNATKFDSGVLADLSPLQGLRLTRFHCARSRVTDLAPLRGMRLTSLLLERNPVVDLTPVAGMPLTYLNLDYTQVADLTPLRGMPLKSLICNHTRVTDLTPIKGMPLEDIACHIQPARDLEILRSLPNLRLINGKPAAEFWQQHDPKHAAFLEWTEATKKLPAEEQIKAVAAKMQELNPGFDGQLQPTLVNDRVSGVKFACDAVTNLAPLRALSDLRDLQCSGSASGKGRLRDLGPLQGLQLWKLFAGWSRIDDLSPLANMPLTYVNLGGTQVSDLTPLGEVKTLQTLMINNTRVNDLGPVKGSRALTYLNCTETPVADFTPLRDAPLNDLYAKPETVTRQADVLRTIKTLTTINDKPAATFWKELDAAKP